MRQQFYTTQKIGPKRSKTPEGFLLCEEVPVARTGMMIYGPDEVPVEPGPDGITKIFRDEDEVFNPTTMASANGKSFTIQHPDEDVIPDNWATLTHGIGFNPRRGEGANDDLLIVDLLITTPEGIKAVEEDGIEEISMGYDADYEQIEPGIGKQSSIIFNHFALVEQGRCGTRCAIGDSKPTNTKEVNMATKKRSKYLDALMRAFKAKDSSEVEEIAETLDEELETTKDEDGDTHVHVHMAPAKAGEPVLDEDPESEAPSTTNDDGLEEYIARNDAEHEEFRTRLKALEDALLAKANEAATGDEEVSEQEVKDELSETMDEEEVNEALKTKDSLSLSNSFQDTVAMAEILVPGIRIPTFDRAQSRGKTFQVICKLRKTALDLAYGQPETRAILDDLLKGRTIDQGTKTCDSTRNLFRAAAAVRGTMNKTGNGSTVATAAKKATALSLADINEMNRKAYGG